MKAGEEKVCSGMLTDEMSMGGVLRVLCCELKIRYR
jgi:hypothetical protein